MDKITKSLVQIFIKLILILFIAFIGVNVVLGKCEWINKWEWIKSPITFWLIYLLIFIYAIGLSKLDYIQLFKPRKYLQILFSIVSFSFVFLSILFGYHTNVLTEYDKSTNEQNYWLDHKNILDFPSKMTQIYNGNYVEKISFENKDKETNLNLFIFDNTNSASKNFNSNTLVSLFDNTEINDIETSSLTTSNQIISLYLFKELIKTKSNDKFLFYKYEGNGNKHIPILFKNNNSIISENQYQNEKYGINKSLIDALKKTPNQSNTNISDFINVNKILDDKLNKYPRIKLFFISDFINNDDQKYFDFEKIILNPNIISINIIRTKGVDRKGEDVFKNIKSSSRKHPDKMTTTSIDLIDKNLVSQIKLSMNEIYLIDLTKFNDDQLNFYYPWIIKNNTHNIKSKFCFNNPPNEFSIKITDIDNPQNIDLYELRKNNQILNYGFINQESIVIDSVRKSDTFELILFNLYTIENHRCIINFYSNSSLKKFAVNAMPILPNYSIIALNIFYTLLLGSLCLIFFYIFFSTFLDKKLGIIRNQHRTLFLNIICLLFYILLCSFSLIPILYFIWCDDENIAIKIIVFGVLLSLTLPHFIINVKEKLIKYKYPK